ncbi:nicotinamide riboside kinase 1 [Caerostris darwini]|uniref:Nicotinamide riboside kinase 1 n=1 Tax=Caerostris darwini TaxID=1538125 RepID=A0AAV4TWZ4_9ARAC|nr:nicotinamide riboside kinase 1 [Caerostris darwini]
MSVESVIFTGLCCEMRYSCKMQTQWITVGISGCTNGGKTTLASALANRFSGSIVVNQDEYFRSDDSKEHVLIPELNHKNWERLESVNWDAMMEHLENIIHSPPPEKHSLLIVEGHIIFNHDKIRNLFQKKYFLTLNREECLRRRVQRVYEPPDVPGYFDICVWPMYLLNLQDVEKNCPDVKYFDGNSEKDDILKSVINDIESIVEST